MSHRAFRPPLPETRAAETPSSVPFRGVPEGAPRSAALFVLPEAATDIHVESTRAEPGTAVRSLVRALARQAAREALSQPAGPRMAGNRPGRLSSNPDQGPILIKESP